MEGRWIRLLPRRGLIVALGAAACVAAQAASDGGTLAVTATVLPKNSCKFGGGPALELQFGTISPAATVAAPASTTTSFRCSGSAPSSSYLITASNGLHYDSGAASRQVRHDSLLTEHMAYSLTLSPQSGTVPRNTDQVITVTGSIAPSAFQQAPAGGYTDTVILTLNP